MKRTIYFIVFFFFYTTGFVLADNQIPISPVTPPGSPSRTRGQNGTIVTATLTDTEVVLNFTTAAGIATITVTDNTGSIVYQQTIDTDTNKVLEIPIDSWDSGNYTLTIQYSDIALSGDFSF
ncbi:MAG: DUF3244 domain-containing protein [Paludibacter sp.]|nr:DUF3244 domain-containing protein [Paludibacter sp.]